METLFWCTGPYLLAAVLIAGLIAIAGYESCRLETRVVQDSQPDNRTLARNWIKNSIPASEHILLDLDNVPHMGFIDFGVL